MRTLAFKVIVGVPVGHHGRYRIGPGPVDDLGWAGLTGLGVALHIIAWVLFNLPWVLTGWVRGWLTSLAAVGLAVFATGSLPPWGLGGALLAVLVMEIIFCLLGIWWVPDYWRRPIYDSNGPTWLPMFVLD